MVNFAFLSIYLSLIDVVFRAVIIAFPVDRDRSIQSKFRSFDLAVLPQNNNHYFVCTDMASLLHRVSALVLLPQCFDSVIPSVL